MNDDELSDAYMVGVKAAADAGDDGTGWDAAGLRTLYGFARARALEDAAKVAEEWGRDACMVEMTAVYEAQVTARTIGIGDQIEPFGEKPTRSLVKLLAAIRALGGEGQ